MYRATRADCCPIQARDPDDDQGEAVKYLSPKGQPSHLDVHPRNLHRIRDISESLWITEGLKKGDALTSRGCCVVVLTGVFNWRSKYGTLGTPCTRMCEGGTLQLHCKLCPHSLTYWQRQGELLQ